MNNTYSEIAAYYQSHDPGRLHGFMPEYPIEEPANYWPAKTFAVGAMMAWENLKDDEVDNTHITYCHASMLAMTYQTPTFFVASPLVAAALRTELPDDLDLSQLNWPFPIMVFMLPKDAVCHPTEGRPAFICIGSMPASWNFPTPTDWRGEEIKIESPYPHIFSVSMMPEVRPPIFYYASASVPPDKSTLSEVETKNFSTEFFLGTDPVLLGDTSETAILDSSRFMFSLWRLGLTLVLLIEAHPELVEYGRPLKKIRSKRTGQPTQWYGPNIVGRLYRNQVYPDNKDAGQGSSKRPHWVRGHLRNQPYGAKQALRKLIWVQPYRTGIDEC